MNTIKSTVDIERSLIKTYRRDVYKKFVQGVNKYELISPGDKIAVAISGGKDSLTLARIKKAQQGSLWAWIYYNGPRLSSWK